VEEEQVVLSLAVLVARVEEEMVVGQEQMGQRGQQTSAVVEVVHLGLALVVEMVAQVSSLSQSSQPTSQAQVQPTAHRQATRMEQIHTSSLPHPEHSH
jgi:hypothetical protein